MFKNCTYKNFDKLNKCEIGFVVGAKVDLLGMGCHEGHKGVKLQFVLLL